MGLVLDPGVGDGDGRRLPRLQGAARGDLVLPVGLVDQHLGDRHRVGAVVDHRQLDLPGLRQPDPLHVQRLDRGNLALAEPGVGGDDQRQHPGQERERQEGEQDCLRGETGAPVAVLGAGAWGDGRVRHEGPPILPGTVDSR